MSTSPVAVSPAFLATCWSHTGDAQPGPGGRHLSPLDLRTRAEAAAGAGFTGIGFTIEDLQASPLSLEEVGAMLDDLGLVHREVELVEDWWTTGELRRASDATRAALVEAAGVLGAVSVKAGPAVGDLSGSIPELLDPDEVAHWAEELHRLGDDFAPVGARVAIEPLPFANIRDFRRAADLVLAADHAGVGLVVDLWHVDRGPSTVDDLRALPGEKVFVVELNDGPAPTGEAPFPETRDRRLDLGRGTFDVHGMVGALHDVGFSGPWGVEIISHEQRRGPLAEVLAENLRAARAVVSSVVGAGARS
ncbi:sugar phosphate isomerase/epimerase family protein [Nocardioides bruguierae]|uniref:Sugar phosphate isomerase/epimerase n=1 Tax=Nocardioides bruguierae TaxID=2945102 RepID=A0A9X2ICX8_9ACTN|nr:sugar phosphate isomerase/epimerase family protein [Nocardioides bruguierae]MCM0618682.1 sugar phosphate isomerase/epimerase [Nocardioides bruguierae]